MEIATYEIFQKCDSRPLVKVPVYIVKMANSYPGALSV
jgi:hypothetical protein